MKKLNCILLVDDDETTNFYNHYLLKKAEVAESIQIVKNGKEALNYLTNHSGEAGAYPQPDLIFLDINMPVMDGFEFLEAYSQLDEKIKGKVVVCMLTTSLHEDDLNRAKQFVELSDYLYKPLKNEGLLEIIEKHFSA